MSDFDPALLEDLKQRIIEIRPVGFGITIAEFSEATGKSLSASGRHLNKEVKEGRYKMKKMIWTRSPTCIYYKEEKV